MKAKHTTAIDLPPNCVTASEILAYISSLKALAGELADALEARYPNGWVHITSDAKLIEKAREAIR